MIITKITNLYKRFFQDKKVLNILFIVTWLFIVAGIIWASWSSRDQLSGYLEDIDGKYAIGVIGFYVLALVFTIMSWISIIKIFTPGIPVLDTHSNLYDLLRLPPTPRYNLVHRRAGIDV